MKKKGIHYGFFIQDISKEIETIDLTPYLIDIKDVDYFFTDEPADRGHFSKEGDQFVAEKIYGELQQRKII